MAVTMTVSEARAAWAEVLAQVEGGEEVRLTRHGRPVAVVVRPDRLPPRPRVAEVYADAERIGRMLEEARKRPLGPGRALDPEYAEELIAEIRAGRDAR